VPLADTDSPGLDVMPVLAEHLRQPRWEVLVQLGLHGTVTVGTET